MFAYRKNAAKLLLVVAGLALTVNIALYTATTEDKHSLGYSALFLNEILNCYYKNFVYLKSLYNILCLDLKNFLLLYFTDGGGGVTYITINEEVTDSFVAIVEHITIVGVSISHKLFAAANKTFATNDGLQMFTLSAYAHLNITCPLCFTVHLRLTASSQNHTMMNVALNLSLDDHSYPPLWKQRRFISPLQVGGDIRQDIDMTLYTDSLSASDTVDVTIRMAVNYVINKQRNTSTASSSSRETSHNVLRQSHQQHVNITYTWNVCNVSLPLVDYNTVSSALFPTNQDKTVVQFYLFVFLFSTDEDVISVFSALQQLPRGMSLPLTVNHTIALLDTSPERNSLKTVAVTKAATYNELRTGWGHKFTVDYTYYTTQMMYDSCVAFRYHALYSTNSSHEP